MRLVLCNRWHSEWDKCTIDSVKNDNMARKRQFDGIDARILVALDDDPHASITHIAKAVGISRNTVHARLLRLENEGALESFSLRVSPESLGMPMVAFVSLTIRQHEEDAAVEGLRKIPEIVEVHFTTGDADLFARVVARDTQDLHRVMGLILKTPGVARSSTRISLGPAMQFRVRPLLERAAGE